MRRTRRTLAAGAILWLAACATTTSLAGGGDQMTITSAELRAETASRNVADVVRQRRPQWLTARGATDQSGGGEIVVYLDRVALGGPAALQNVGIETVESVQFLRGPEATSRFGTGHTKGAILLVSRRR